MILLRRGGRILQLPELAEQAVEEIPLRGKICQPGARKDTQNYPLHFQGMLLQRKVETNFYRSFTSRFDSPREWCGSFPFRCWDPESVCFNL
jgi:hypothetical protein